LPSPLRQQLALQLQEAPLDVVQRLVEAVDLALDLRGVACAPLLARASSIRPASPRPTPRSAHRSTDSSARPRLPDGLGRSARWRRTSAARRNFSSRFLCRSSFTAAFASVADFTDTATAVPSILV
jgi:hypothetical protein